MIRIPVLMTVSHGQLMEKSTRRRDRLSLLTLLEGSVESKKNVAIFNAFFDAGGLKVLNGWLSEAVSRVFYFFSKAGLWDGCILISMQQESDKSAFKLWQRVLNFLNRFSWIPAPPAKAVAPAGSKESKKEGKSDVSASLSMGPSGVKAAGIGDGKLVKIEPVEHSNPPEVKSQDQQSKSVETKVDIPVKIEAVAPKAAGGQVDHTTAIVDTAEHSKEFTRDVKTGSGGVQDCEECSEKQKMDPVVVIVDEVMSEAVGPVIVIVDDVMSEADPAKRMGSDACEQSDGSVETKTMEKISFCGESDNIRTATDDSLESMKSPTAVSCAQSGERCDESASDTGTPRAAFSRESSAGEVPSKEFVNQEGKSIPASARVSPGDSTSKTEKPKKESKSKSEKSDKTVKGRSAHELVELIVEVSALLL